jgi:triphosphatase
LEKQGDAVTELELKLLIDETTASDVWARARKAKLADVCPRARPVKSTYFDTADHDLRDAGIALRLRRDGRRNLQTVKLAATLDGGLSNVQELESALPSAKLDLDAIPDDVIRNTIVRLINGAAIKPTCITDVKRGEGEVHHRSGTVARLAVDAVEVSSGQQSARFYELELEHVSGSPAGLFDMAKDLLPDGGFTFSDLSKAERGGLLAATGDIEPPIEPRYAQAVALVRSQTAEQAAQQVLRECAAQIAANITAVRHLSIPEGPHQLRIGLRRLRSALVVFKPVIGGAAARHLATEARWLGQQVGQLRDLDVIIGDIIAREAKLHPELAGFDVLSAELGRRAHNTREKLLEELTAPRVQSFLFDLMKFIETRGWISLHDTGQTVRLAAPVQELASKALNKRWKKATGRAHGIQKLSIEERHALRKELKKLRYAVEFLRPLYPDKEVKPFLKRLKRLQDLFGDLNDAAMVKTQLIEGELLADADVTAGIAAGWIAGAASARAELHWEHAKDLWKDLNHVPVYW